MCCVVNSEHEVDIEDSLSWDESDPESKEMSDSYSEVQVNQILKRSKMLTVVKFLEKMDMCGCRSQKLSEHQRKYCQRETRTEREWMSSTHP